MAPRWRIPPDSSRGSASANSVSPTTPSSSATRSLRFARGQRAALLRTVVQDRPVLLLDEPFGALDALTRTEMQLWLSEMRTRFGWTVLLVTHDVREAVLLADRVAVLGPRPTSVLREVPVDLPRPRDLAVLTDPAFAAAEVDLLGALTR